LARSGLRSELAGEAIDVSGALVMAAAPLQWLLGC
jgi:hypothetical protein